jgi:hypothetical protein
MVQTQRLLVRYTLVALSYWDALLLSARIHDMTLEIVHSLSHCSHSVPEQPDELDCFSLHGHTPLCISPLLPHLPDSPSLGFFANADFQAV